MHVLVVDGSASLRRRLLELLSEYAIFEALEAQSVADATRIMNHQQIDAAVLDVQLDTSGGFELIRRIKRHSNRVIVIVLTNGVSELHRVACEERGADFFLDKSLEFERVAEILAQQVRPQTAQASHLGPSRR